MSPTFSPENEPRRLAEDAATVAEQMQDLGTVFSLHMQKFAQEHGERTRKAWLDMQPLFGGFSDAAKQGRILDDAKEYIRDASERTVLTLDVLRERGNADVAHQAAGTPPVLIYDYEIVMDAHDFERPANYMLLKIKPAEGVEVFDWKRPYMIIDPRAGHGAGIGGFKADSQVGVALHNGHPVYFVAFRPMPEPGQTMADVMRAEAEFVAEIRRRHPDAPKPIIV
ncbi:DUF3141 domain-containing protein, partial [Rhodoblastus sp.]